MGALSSSQSVKAARLVPVALGMKAINPTIPSHRSTIKNTTNINSGMLLSLHAPCVLMSHAPPRSVLQ
jgi:hypothetical protein